MIRNEREYKDARRRYETDQEAEERQRDGLVRAGLTPKQVEKAMEPLRSFHAQLAEEIDWYENVQSGRVDPVERLTDMGRLLIALRISRRLSQKQLADRLGISEAAVSRDERNEYHGITLERAQRILDALEACTVTTVQDHLAKKPNLVAAG